MTRGKKIIIAVLVLFIVGAIAGVAAVLGYLSYRENQTAMWLADAEAAFAREDWPEARNWYQWYLPRRGDDIDALEKYAHANLQIVDNRAASLQRVITAYQQILRHDPERIDFEDKLLDIYVKLGAWPTIEYYVQEYMAHRPDDQQLRILLARALAGAGRGGEAIDAYDALVREGITHSDVLRDYVDLLRDRNEMTRATLLLDELLEVRPEDIHVRTARAYLFAAQRNWEGMRQEIDAALALDASHPFALQLQAQYGIATQQYDIARTYGEQALEAAADNAGIYTLLAHVYSRLGQNDKALELLASADRMLAADNPEILMALSELQVGMGLYEDAQSTRERYRRINPGQQPIVQYMEARELLSRGQADEAVALLTMVTELRPGFAPARFYLALAHLTAGDTARGRSLLESYVSQNPTDERAQALLAQETGGAATLEEQVVQARLLLAQEVAAPEALVSSSLSLFDASRLANEVDEQRGLIFDLLHRAIERDPTASIGYRGLAELHAVLGEFEEAHAAIEQGRQNQVPVHDLLLSQASVALSERQSDTARALFEEFAAGEGVDVSDVVRWATLFSRKGYGQDSLEILDEARTWFNGDQVHLLTLEQARVAARNGMLSHARTRLDEARDSNVLASGYADEFRAAQLDVAEQLLAQAEESQNQEQAEAIIAEVLADQPDNSRALTLSGQLILLEETPDMAEALRIFESALGIDPDSTGAHLGLARVALSRGEAGRAATHLERAISNSPDVPSYRLQLADVYIRLSRHEEAQRLLNRVLDDQPTNPVALELMVSSLMASGNPGRAQEMLARLSAQAESDAVLQRRVDALQGGLLLAQGDATAAVAFLEQQFAEDTDNAALAQGLSAALIGTERIDDAVALLQGYVERNPSNPDGYVALAQALIRRQAAGDVAAASEAVTRALLLEPDYLPALKEQIEIQIRRGNTLQALTLCDRYLARNPNDVDVMAHWVRLVAQEPDSLDEAVDMASRALALEERADLLYLRGSLLHSQGGQSERVIQDFQRLARMQEQTPANVDLMMADAYLATGRRDLAQVFFDAALRKAAAGESLDTTTRQRVDRQLRGEG